MNWLDPGDWERLLTSVAVLLTAIAGVVRYRAVKRQATVQERRALRSKELARLRKALRLKDIELERCREDRDRAERAVKLYDENQGRIWIER